MPTEVIDIPFISGVDTKSHPYLVDEGAFFDIKNGILNIQGSLEKRFGLVALSLTDTDGNTISSVRKLIGYGDELILLDGTKAYSYLVDTDEWKPIGPATLMHIDETPLSNSRDQTSRGTDPIPTGFGYINGYYIFANAEDGGKYTIVDSTTGNVVVEEAALPNVVSNSSGPPRIIILGTDAVIVYEASSGGGRLSGYTIDMTDPTAGGTEFAVATAYVTGGYFDVIPSGNGTHGLVAYVTAAGSGHLTYFTSSAFVNTASTGLALFSAAHPIGMCSSTGISTNATIYAFTVNAAGTHIGVYKALWTFSPAGFSASANAPSLVPIVGNAVNAIAAVAAEDDVDKATCFREEEPAAASLTSLYEVYSFSVTTAPAIDVADALFKAGAGIVARPFKQGTKIYAPLAFASGTITGTQVHVANNMGLLFNSSAEVVGRFLAGTLGWNIGVGFSEVINAPAPGAIRWGDLAEVESGKFSTVRLRMGAGDRQITTAAGTDYQRRIGQNTLVTFDFNKGGEHVEFGDQLLINAGLLLSYDKTRVVEHNFLWYPQPITLTGSVAGAGGLVGGQTYNVILVYQMIDERGNLKYSIASTPESITIGGADDTITVSAPTLRFSAMDEDTLDTRVIIQAYRTAQGPGTIYYADNSVTNDPTATSVSIVLDATDAAIEDNAQIYITGAVLNDDAPGPATSLAVSNTRILLGGGQNTVQYSKLRQEERISGFSAAFRKLLPAEGGEVTNVHVLGSNIIIWKERAIYRMYGAGPNDTGLAGSFSDPEPISRNIGCRANTPVLQLDDGIIFQSADGVWMLGENLQLGYIGAPIRDWVDFHAGHKFTTAVRTDDEDQARFTLEDQNFVPVLDTLNKRWWRLEYANTVTSIARWNNRWAYALDNAGTPEVYKKSVVLYTDDGAAVDMVVKTPWYKSRGFTSEGRLKWVQFLGRWKSAHTLQFKVYYDYDETVAQTVEFNLSAGYDVDDPIRVRFKPARQVFESVRFDIQDTDQAGTKRSLDMVSMRLEVQPRRKRRVGGQRSK